MKLIEKLEAIKFDFLDIFLFIFSFAFLRIFLEYKLLSNSLDPDVVMHLVSFFFAMFLGSTLLVSLLAGEKANKVKNIILFSFLLIIIPPLIDYYIFGRTWGYFYAPEKNFLKNLFTFVLYEKGAGPGILLEVYSILSLFTLYVFHKTKSIRRTLTTFFLLYLGALFFTTKNPIISHSNTLASVYYLLISILFLFLISLKKNKKMLLGFCKNIELIRSLFFLIFVLAGAWILGIKNIDNLIASSLAIFFAWQFAIVINDIYDQSIDRISNKNKPLISGVITSEEYSDIAIIFALLAVFFALAVNLTVFILVILCIALSIIYSVPPLRLRKHLFSTVIIGLGSLLSFLVGWFSQNRCIGCLIMRSKIFIFGIGIFLATSIGSVIKDIKDYRGDKEAGVRTIFTVFGLQKGMRLALFFLAICFLLPLTLFHTPLDIVLFPAFTLFACLDFKKTQNIQRPILYGIIVILYILLRIQGLL